MSTVYFSIQKLPLSSQYETQPGSVSSRSILLIDQTNKTQPPGRPPLACVRIFLPQNNNAGYYMAPLPGFIMPCSSLRSSSSFSVSLDSCFSIILSRVSQSSLFFFQLFFRRILCRLYEERTHRLIYLFTGHFFKRLECILCIHRLHH